MNGKFPYGDPERFLYLDGLLSTITNSPRAPNSPNFNPFTDEVWGSVPRKLDPAYAKATKKSPPLEMSHSDFPRWEIEGGYHTWSVSVRPKYDHQNLGAKDRVFWEVEVDMYVTATGGGMNIERATQLGAAFTLASEWATEWNKNNDGRVCRFVKD